MAFEQDRGIAPVQGHFVHKRDFGWGPADTSQAGDRFPVGTRFITLGLKRVRTVPERQSCLLVSDYRTIHSADAQRPVRVCIQVDEHALGAVPHSHQGGAPGASIFRGGRRVDLNQAA
jgi:hypothetical protein